MAERLGLGIIPGVGWRAADIRAIARDAEDAGFEAIATTEVNPEQGTPNAPSTGQVTPVLAKSGLSPRGSRQRRPEYFAARPTVLIDLVSESESE
jgi:hypothetical protein